MTKIEQANRAADLILPRLEAYKRSCGSGDIHDVLVQIAIVSNYQKLMLTTKKHDPEMLAGELLEATKAAEDFLVSTVLSGD